MHIVYVILLSVCTTGQSDSKVGSALNAKPKPMLSMTHNLCPDFELVFGLQCMDGARLGLRGSRFRVRGSFGPAPEDLCDSAEA